ncbi:MAG: biopolymer transporter ExbB [Pseudomonadota bacterium]
MSLIEGERAEFRPEFSPPVRQVPAMVIVLVLVGVAGGLLAQQIQTVFEANPYLNAVIGGVFVVGVIATFWQITQISSAVNWLRDIDQNLAAGNRPPRMLAAMAPMLREKRMKNRLAASSTRTILDSVSTRLDEARDITRYITTLLIFIGLLGTFWGLSQTVPAVVDTIGTLAPTEGGTFDFSALMTGLEKQLGGMGTAFASSLLGLAGSLTVGLLELFAGHGQNRFFRELEEWLASFTRLGLVNEGEGPDSALVALLERVDEGLEKTTEFATKAEVARIEAENRLARAADVVAEMATQIEHERSAVSQMVHELRETRENQMGREHAQLNVLKRIDSAQSSVATGQQAMLQLMDRALDQRRAGSQDGEMRGHMRSIDAQLRAIADDMAEGRHQAVQALRAELRVLINLIDERTGGEGR